MRVLIAGGCGFVGSVLSEELSKHFDVVVIDNLSRAGSETNDRALRDIGVEVHRGDVRCMPDIESVGRVDWIIDAAAEPSVTGGSMSRRRLVDNNLVGSLNLIEIADRYSAGFVFLSTSRVYSIKELTCSREAGLFPAGIDESFPTTAPVSLYGATKLAVEVIAQESLRTAPCVINRCGLMAGAGQFSRADQGIIAFWIRQYRRGEPLSYHRWNGEQTRCILHPSDLAELVLLQISAGRSGLFNVGGGSESARSLAAVTKWCERRYGRRQIGCQPDTHSYDVPWIVLDASKARHGYGWRPRMSPEAIFREIANS